MAVACAVSVADPERAPAGSARSRDGGGFRGRAAGSAVPHALPGQQPSQSPPQGLQHVRGLAGAWRDWPRGAEGGTRGWSGKGEGSGPCPQHGATVWGGSAGPRWRFVCVGVVLSMVGVVPSIVGVMPSMVGVVPSIVGVVPSMVGVVPSMRRAYQVRTSSGTPESTTKKISARGAAGWGPLAGERVLSGLDPPPPPSCTPMGPRGLSVRVKVGITGGRVGAIELKCVVL